MKKNLILLTGIVILITVLAAVGCTRSTKQQEPEERKTVKIYLKDRVIDGTMHLEMYDSKKPGCPVIDNLETEVFPGDKVIFFKAEESNVDEVISIRPIDRKVDFISGGDGTDRSLYKLDIDPEAPLDTIVKYLIEFTVNKDTFNIDPYLKIPKQL